ncbi:unnamed protein product [Phytophthora fragariaefolia]|uniref:Unnamed protein product n=1 Tax=Phytophthora fragariaefolia TaxID=1490495 RepID=A0A9W6X6G7_9STRA|nr:unnamed protein product [Phytophthora fragariaefolia]
MARTGSLKWGVIEVECVRNALSPFDYADRFWEHPSWTAPLSRSPSLRSAGAIVAPALVFASLSQCTSPQSSTTRWPPIANVKTEEIARASLLVKEVGETTPDDAMITEPIGKIADVTAEVAEASVDELYDDWQNRLAITPRRRAVSDSGSGYSDRSCKSECESDGDYVDTAESGRGNIGGRTDGQNCPHGFMGDGRRDEAHRSRWGDQDRRAWPEYGSCAACGDPRHSMHRCFRRCKFCTQVHRDGQCEHYKLYEDTLKFVKSKHDKDSLPSELQGIYSSNLNERAHQL